MVNLHSLGAEQAVELVVDYARSVIIVQKVVTHDRVLNSVKVDSGSSAASVAIDDVILDKRSRDVPTATAVGEVSIQLDP